MTVTQANLAPAELQALADAYALGTVAVVQHTGKVYRLQAAHGMFALRFFNAGVTRVHVEATHVHWSRERLRTCMIEQPS